MCVVWESVSGVRAGVRVVRLPEAAAGRSVFYFSVSASPPAPSEGRGPPNKKQKQKVPQPPHSAPQCPRGPSDLPRPPGTSPYQPLGVGVALNTSGRNPPPSSKPASYDRGDQPDIKPRLRPCGRLLVYKDVEDSLLCHISKPQLLKCKWRRDMTKNVCVPL